jgi:hypothetical protein
VSDRRDPAKLELPAYGRAQEFRFLVDKGQLCAEISLRVGPGGGHVKRASGGGDGHEIPHHTQREEDIGALQQADSPALPRIRSEAATGRFDKQDGHCGLA